MKYLISGGSSNIGLNVAALLHESGKEILIASQTKEKRPVNFKSQHIKIEVVRDHVLPE